MDLTYSDPQQMQDAVTKFGEELLKIDTAVYHTSEAYTRFKDIETNVSVREQFTREDYDYFRDSETVPTHKRSIIKAARKAYQKIGLIHNIIDLMGDFTCQGIKIVHAQPQIEKFYQGWFEQVKGRDRSERFANLLYREANVAIKRDTARLKLSNVRDLRQAVGEADLLAEPPIDPAKREVPWDYTFISPLVLDVIGNELASFVGEKIYSMKMNAGLIRTITNPKNDAEKRLVQKLPNYVIEAAKQNGLIIFDDKLKLYHYKKDDWEIWATPFVYPIMDDLVLLEKLKLADMTALDGAISYIRIWKLGSLDHKILPNPKAIEKLRNILLQNVSGGSMDLVWDPAIEVDETSSDISKFLGMAKYEPTMMNIFQGLGIPPTLNGSSKSGSGMTNNFIALKTLIERLNYGRTILSSFWNEEIKVVQKAMGFREPAHIMYDHMVLSDESSFLALLVQLVDRNIISEDAVRDRFGEISGIEKNRIKREEKAREKGDIPPKSGPYHNAQTEDELRKMALQNGYAPSEVGLELKEKKKGEISKIEIEKKSAETDIKVAGQPGQGRPINSKDTKKRKQRTPKPLTSQSVFKQMIWAQRIHGEISDMILPHVLKAFACKNVRSMTDEQFKQFEIMKFATICELEPFEEVTPDRVLAILKDSPQIPEDITTVYTSLVEPIKEPTINQLRDAQALAYALIV